MSAPTKAAALRRASINLAEAKFNGATEVEIFTEVIRAMRGHSFSTSQDTEDAQALCTAYGDLWGTPGTRTNPTTTQES